MVRAFTTLGAGPDVDRAYEAAVAQGGPLASTEAVREVDVPAGANPSKLGTWVQRVAQDPDATADVPEEHRATVERLAAALRSDRSTCLAIALDGDLADRTRARAGAPPDAGAYLLFGLADEG
ncbi:MAG TPA: hypothetical protein VHM89_12760 [Acidimicrobiales bacterium]|nr:hypothetical protein [Acidimicrobiales bacterium]